MKRYYSSGKLLLTGEYLVLDGAKALAVPTKFGQSLSVAEQASPNIHWQSKDHQGNIWFEDHYNIQKASFATKTPVSETLAAILQEAQQLNPDFLNDHTGYQVITELDFPRDWGLGSSSTLINNIAQWAKVDAYQLLWRAFGGSGYDIACAQHKQALLYQLEGQKPSVMEVAFHPAFQGSLFFVYLNAKQNSREAIQHYRTLSSEAIQRTIPVIDALTQQLLHASSLSSFEAAIAEHEKVMSSLLKLSTVKERLFPDFGGAIKSLGAWGGDFVLVTGSKDAMNYFRNKGYHTIIPFTEMINQ